MVPLQKSEKTSQMSCVQSKYSAIRHCKIRGKTTELFLEKIGNLQFTSL